MNTQIDRKTYHWQGTVHWAPTLKYRPSHKLLQTPQLLDELSRPYKMATPPSSQEEDRLHHLKLDPADIYRTFLFFHSKTHAFNLLMQHQFHQLRWKRDVIRRTWFHIRRPYYFTSISIGSQLGLFVHVVVTRVYTQTHSSWCVDAGRLSLRDSGRNMPRVVSDQKTKFETDDLFKKLCQDVDVS